MKKIKYNELSREMLDQLEQGAFLTVKKGEFINTMTIGWGLVGYVWNKPIFTTLVRFSRHTYEMLKDNTEFTVSVPLDGNLKKELAFCGTQSGRDCNKFDETDLTLRESLALDTPVINECALHFECKIVYKQTMEPENLDPIIKKEKYPRNDFHVMYHGEIINCYLTKRSGKPTTSVVGWIAQNS